MGLTTDDIIMTDARQKANQTTEKIALVCRFIVVLAISSQIMKIFHNHYIFPTLLDKFAFSLSTLTNILPGCQYVSKSFNKSYTQRPNLSFHVVERTKTAVKCPKMKNARAKRAKILVFFFVMLNMQICDVLVSSLFYFCMIKQNVYIHLFEGDD